MMLRSIVVSALLLSAIGLPSGAAAQNWPNRPIRFVVPVPPGGGLDALARLLAEPMAKAIGQPFIVENKPGAGANVGTEFVVRQPADGYTVLMSAGFLSVNPYLFKNIAYDPIADLQPVSLVATVPLVLVVNPKVTAGSVKEFIAFARVNPGKLTYASAGIGTAQHLAAELLKSMAGIDVLHVPYKGTGGVVPALLAGEVDSVITPIQTVLPLVRSGKLRALGVADGHRTHFLPDTPTIAEAGGLPGYELPSWYGVHVRSGTAKPIVDRLNREFNAIIRNPQLGGDRLQAMGLSAAGTMTPEQFLEYQKVDLARYGKITKEANIKPE